MPNNYQQGEEDAFLQAREDLAEDNVTEEIPAGRPSDEEIKATKDKVDNEIDEYVKEHHPDDD